MRPSLAPLSDPSRAASLRCPRSADSIIATSVARRSRGGSRPYRHIPRTAEALARWLSALDTVILCTAAAAAPCHVQEGPSSAAPIGQLVARSAVGSSFGQRQADRRGLCCARD